MTPFTSGPPSFFWISLAPSGILPEVPQEKRMKMRIEFSCINPDCADRDPKGGQGITWSATGTKEQGILPRYLLHRDKDAFCPTCGTRGEV